MTKQEKLLQGLAERLGAWASELHTPKTENVAMAGILLRYLNDNDVRIKVEKELPCDTLELEGNIYLVMREDYFESFESVEPLITEVTEAKNMMGVLA